MLDECFHESIGYSFKEGACGRFFVVDEHFGTEIYSKGILRIKSITVLFESRTRLSAVNGRRGPREGGVEKGSILAFVYKEKFGDDPHKYLLK